MARDRLGEKPLYYGWQGRAFLFGSELRALRAHPEFQAEIDRDALTHFWRDITTSLLLIPFFRGISKLPPGTILTVSADIRNPRVDRYWDARKIIEQAQSDPFSGSPAEADGLEKAAQGRCLETDDYGCADWRVPSGGVDSSAIVALMQQQSSRPVRTFTIGFQDDDFNEAVYAKSIARHLGTDHTELYVTSRHAQEVIPRLPGIYSEPFADSSQIPTFLVSELPVNMSLSSLSGDGGDELFGGYNRYVFGWSLWKSFHASH